MSKENIVRTTVVVEKSLHRSLRILAAEANVTVQSLMTQALTEWFERRKKDQQTRVGRLEG
jgi:predicted transcriptional regulator